MSVLNYLTEALNKFIFPPKMKDNFVIVDGINNAKNWKAKTILANSGGIKGKMDGVRYVGISVDSNIIVPISISDEHQNGYELLNYFINKNLIPNEDYITIYATGNNYVYSENKKDIANTIKAYQKFLAYGGSNRPVIAGEYYRGDMKDYINRGGNVTIKKGEIQGAGKDIIDSLEHITKQYNKFLDAIPPSGEVKRLFEFTKEFLNRFLGINGYIIELVSDNLNSDYIEKLIKQIEDEEDELDFHTLDLTIFAYDGLKNMLHNELRKLIKPNADKYKVDKYKRIFGDLKQAYLEFNRLGNL